MLEIRELVLKAVVDRNVKKVVDHTRRLKNNDLNYYQVQQLLRHQNER